MLLLRINKYCSYFADLLLNKCTWESQTNLLPHLFSWGSVYYECTKSNMILEPIRKPRLWRVIYGRSVQARLTWCREQLPVWRHASDGLTATSLASKCPKLFCPETNATMKTYNLSKRSHSSSQEINDLLFYRGKQIVPSEWNLQIPTTSITTSSSQDMWSWTRYTLRVCYTPVSPALDGRRCYGCVILLWAKWVL